MKTVKILNTQTIERLSNKEADKLVTIGKAIFVPKSEWKRVRDAAKNTK